MTLGSVELADGSHVPGFLCEPSALADAEDITAVRRLALVPRWGDPGAEPPPAIPRRTRDRHPTDV